MDMTRHALASAHKRRAWTRSIGQRQTGHSTSIDDIGDHPTESGAEFE